MATEQPLRGRTLAGRLCGVVALLCLPLAAGGADLRSVTVELVDDRYHLESTAWFAVGRDELYRTLTNYDLFEKFTSVFVETRNLSPDASGRPRFYTRMEGCVLLFCKSMRRRGHLRLKPPHEIVAIADPEASDFHYSRERWHLLEEDGGTLMIYKFEMEPAFWVPPIIGPLIIKHTLREGGIDAIDRIEAVAQGKEPKP